MLIKEYSARELTDRGSREMPCQVAVEDTIELYVNKIHVASILATPEMIEELGTGYTLCEGIADASQILDFHSEGRNVFIEIEGSEHFEVWRELRSSGCVGVRWDENEDVSVRSDAVFRRDALRKSLGFLDSDIYRLTRGTHAACLMTADGECILKAIDVGRHNAFDKVVGSAYMKGIDVAGHFIASTGRQSAGMVLKAARAGIPLVATKTAPLNTGIDAAEKAGVCLVCFLSEDKMTVFTHPERLA
ncbi:MAG TPA: formate dehydrogenase accessory sulfurtransferase FdhD [Candidatus Methanoperedenaceae archaeon]|nr:formate dehydrogenase accessory sulfurtransferase FdhD [Candidatus Methanoperedenaceae archaeon]